MLKENETLQKNSTQNTASNCHRPKGGSSSSGSSDNSDQDSSTSKYVVRDDRRERRDGPGGN